MPSTNLRKRQDKSTDAIYAALKVRFPDLPADKSEVVYRLNSASVRVCVVDPSFAGMSLSEREAEVMKALRGVPKSTREDITVLLLLTPQERDEESSLMLQEFYEPSASKL